MTPNEREEFIFDLAQARVSKLSHAGIFAMAVDQMCSCLLYTSPSPRDATLSRMPSSA